MRILEYGANNKLNVSIECLIQRCEKVKVAEKDTG